MESITPTSSAKEGKETSRIKQPFKNKSGTSPSTPSPTISEESYSSFGYRPATKTESKATNPNVLDSRGKNRVEFNRAAFAYGEAGEKAQTQDSPEPVQLLGKYNRSILDKTETTQDPMNQLNPDGSNREDFNYAAFAYRDPKAKETPAEKKPVTETIPTPPIPQETPEPEPVAPIVETPEDTRGAEITQETPEARIEDLNFDIAIGQLTEQERKEIIRERQRTSEDMAQEAALTGKWYQKVWGGIKFSYNKNYEKFRMLDTLKGLPAEEIFSNDRNEFRKRSDQRADELAALMAENEFTKISKNKGFEEGYTDLLASDENKQKSKELISLIKEFSKDPTKNRDDFEQRKKVILEEMIKNAPELKGAISDNFDNVWTKVEYIRDRASALKLSADKIDSMNISMNIRFGKARFESKTKDNETLSNKVEDLISSSKWLSSIPGEKRYWAMALIVTSSSKINSGIQKITTLTGYGSLGATMAISGAVSGTFEYIRKKDQLTETASRLTRRLAVGGNSGEFLDKYGASDMESLIKLEKIEPLLNGIKNLSNLYETATTPQDKEAALTGLLQQIGKFQALYELEEKTGDRFQANSAEELNKIKTETIKTATQILSTINATDPTIQSRYASVFNTEKSKIEKQTELDKKILTAANKSKAIKSAAKVAVVSAIFSGVFSSETFKRGVALGTNNAMSAFGITPEWIKSRGLGGFLPQIEKKYEVIKEFQDITTSVSGQERLSKLMESSNVVDDIVRKYNGTAEGQIATFGGLTRSMWSKTPGEEAVLDIFGRTMKNGSTLLHDFDKGYLEAFNQGKFQVLVTLADGHKVLASPADLIMGADGTLKVDFSKDPGILGEIFKDGHESGLAHIKNIQYGIGDASNMEVVSTIKGGGEAFIPDPTEITQKIVNQTLKISEDIKIDDTPVFFPIFRSPKSGRTPRTTTETTPAAPVAPVSRVERSAPASTPSTVSTPTATTTTSPVVPSAPVAPVSRVERTAPAPSGTVEESFSTKIDKDKLKLEIEKGELDDYSLMEPLSILLNSRGEISKALNEIEFKEALKKLQERVALFGLRVSNTELEKLLLNLVDYKRGTTQFSQKEEILNELSRLRIKYLEEVASLHLGELAKSVKNENLTAEMSELRSEIQEAINSYQISKDKKDLNKLKAKLGSIKSSNPEILKLINSVESAIKISEESKPQPENVLSRLKLNSQKLVAVTLLNRSTTVTPETPAAPVSELGRTAAAPTTPASTTTPVAPVSRVERTAPAPSGTVEESFSTKIDKDKLKLEIEKGKLDDYSLIKPFFILKNSIIQIKGASNEKEFKVALKKLRNHISTLQSGIQGTELEKLLLDLESNLFEKYEPSTAQFSKKEEILEELSGLLDKYLEEVASLHLGELAISVKNENLTVEMSELRSEIQEAINSYQISKDKKDLNKLKAKLGSVKSSNPEILKLINSIESAIKISEESKPQPENVLNQLKHNRNILRVVTLLNRSATATPETPVAPVSELGRTAAVPSRLVFGPAEPTKVDTKAEASEPEKSETDSNKNLIEKLELLKSMISKMIEKLSKNPEKLEELLKEFESDIAPLILEMSETAYCANYKDFLDIVRVRLTIKNGSDSVLKELNFLEKVFVSDIERLK